MIAAGATGADLGYTIRAASADDLAAILRLQSEVPQTAKWSETVWLRLLRKACEGGSHRGVWLAEGAEGVVGFALLGGVLDVCELEMVMVTPAERGGGIGRALCDTAMRWAARNGATAMQLEVRASNEAALRLYASLGFVRQGVRRGYYREPAEDAVLLGTPLQGLELPRSKV